ncbi:kinase-like protein, partial [Zopfia rhizophila CBS 207.26]
ENSNHMHFAKGKDPSYETLGICGSGGYTQVDKVNSDSRYLAIVVSPVAECNLRILSFLRQSSKDRLSLLRSFYRYLATALAYLHYCQMRHKDVKPHKSNVLLTHFGISWDFSELSRSTTSGEIVKTPRYCAPEVGAGGPRNTSSDVWSLGCAFLEMISTLKGESIETIKAYYQTHGSEQTLFYQNSHATIEWGCKARSRRPKGKFPSSNHSGHAQSGRQCTSNSTSSC